MCLISCFPSGTKKYSDDVIKYIKSGAASNTCGSGFMFKRSGSNIIGVRKGYFNVDDLLNEYKTLKFKDEDEIVVHHRIATSGKTNDLNTHPFVISQDLNTCTTVNGDFTLPCLAHNGVFGDYTVRGSDYSDTCHFTREFMAIPEVNMLLERDLDLFKKIFKENIGTWNKVAVLSPYSGLKMIGNFTEDNGYYHSNGGYKSRIYDAGGSSFREKEVLSCSTNNRINNNVKLLNSPSSRVISPRNLSISDFEITPSNFDHFLYVKKTSSQHKGLSLATAYVIPDYDEAAEASGLVTLVEYCEHITGSKSGIVLKIDDFYQNCWFCPRKKTYGTYLTYQKLLKEVGNNPSQSKMKKLQKAIGNAKRKETTAFKDMNDIDVRGLKIYYNHISNKKYGTIPFANKTEAINN